MAQKKQVQIKGDRVAKVRLRILENLHATQARMMAASFSKMQDAVVDCEIASVNQRTYAEFIRPLPIPSCSYTFNIEPMGGPAILDFPLATAYSFIDRQFGGTGSNPPQEARPLTRIERSVMGRVVVRALADLEDTWEALIRIRVSDAELETNPEFLYVAAPSDTVVVVGFEVNSQHASGLVRLCYPLETLFPVLKYLKPGAHPPVEPADDGAHSDGSRVGSKAESETPAPISPSDSLEQIASRRPRDVAGLVQTLLPQAGDEAGDDPGPHQAAVLIACLPSHLASTVLGYCSEEERETIRQAVSELTSITARQRDDLFKAVKERLVQGDYVLKGAVDSARQVMAGTLTGAFTMLGRTPPDQIVPLVTKEHPQTIALILSQLDADQAADVVSGLPEELQADVSYRIATMGNMSPEVLRELEENLARDLHAVSGGQITGIGGPKAVAEILNRTGGSTEKDVLTRLDAQDPELAEEVRLQVYTFDDIARQTDREIKMIIRETDPKDLSVALKGASDETKERLFSNMSEEAAAQIKEEMACTGPVRMVDAQEVQIRVIQVVRQLEEAGQVTIARRYRDEKWV